MVALEGGDQALDEALWHLRARALAFAEQAVEIDLPGGQHGVERRRPSEGHVRHATERDLRAVGTEHELDAVEPQVRRPGNRGRSEAPGQMGKSAASEPREGDLAIARERAFVAERAIGRPDEGALALEPRRRDLVLDENLHARPAILDPADREADRSGAIRHGDACAPADRPGQRRDLGLAIDPRRDALGIAIPNDDGPLIDRELVDAEAFDVDDGRGSGARRTGRDPHDREVERRRRHANVATQERRQRQPHGQRADLGRHCVGRIADANVPDPDVGLWQQLQVDVAVDPDSPAGQVRQPLRDLDPASAPVDEQRRDQRGRKHQDHENRRCRQCIPQSAPPLDSSGSEPNRCSERRDNDRDSAQNATILPGFMMLSGSNARFTSRMASSVPAPSSASRYFILP